MGFLDRAIRRGISEGVGKAVGNAISKAVEPKATELANHAAQRIDAAAGSAAQQTNTAVSGLSGAFANLERAAQGYATEMSKNMKICPDCGQPADAQKKFCPSCGAKLPEQTVAQGAVCTACGAQNSIGTKFCAECGTKLPAAIQEEQAALRKDEAVMLEWDTMLSAYPKWNCGGSGYNIEQLDGGVMFAASFNGNSAAARQAVTQYRILLQENGFRLAGQYPDVSHLYKMVNGVCYHVDTEHCFDGDSDWPTVYFNIAEPYGGFNYVKPEPKKQFDITDLFKR